MCRTDVAVHPIVRILSQPLSHARLPRGTLAGAGMHRIPFLFTSTGAFSFHEGKQQEKNEKEGEHRTRLRIT